MLRWLSIAFLRIGLTEFEDGHCATIRLYTILHSALELVNYQHSLALCKKVDYVLDEK
jgi:hypothetical protein